MRSDTFKYIPNLDGTRLDALSFPRALLLRTSILVRYQVIEISEAMWIRFVE